MATGDASAPNSAERPFQFTLRQLLILTAACAFLLALIYHWGPLGFVVCYVVACVAAMCFGVWRWRSDIFLSGLAIFAFGCCWFPALDGGGRGGSRKSSCQNNLHNIALALQEYHDMLGCFPPPYIADANGKPMHSWRVLLLPYLDQKSLYKKYRFDEPWDGPNNSKLHATVLKIYSCPERPPKQPPTDTSYVVVVGPKTVFPENGYVRMADILDGTPNTIMLVEVHNSGIHWMEPRDLHVSQMPMTINPPRGQGISSGHNGGAHVAYVDGSVQFLLGKTSPKHLRAALTLNGKEPPRHLLEEHNDGR